MWEYVKGSEADFEGAPEWAIIRTKNYWYETGERSKGRWFSIIEKKEGYNPSFNGIDERIAQRRKVYDLQSRVNDANLEQAFDTVQRPAHYNQSGIECIDAIAAAVKGKSGIEAALVGNVIKYLWRYELKNGVEDVQKAQWYLERLVKELSK